LDFYLQVEKMPAMEVAAWKKNMKNEYISYTNVYNGYVIVKIIKEGKKWVPIGQKKK
jgi:hypothetical protein